ncbi:hypothetical protein F2P81_009796 [Scophthalmus maximus]|uniref:Uncharacterized protein n=1 Tax=Scophthalmus maximus TaxID=52904 RepID=A0A6A4T426_SCOMX|nr:hypothetical protein F2P81_009796 [Scophthalmus maximus]
MTPSSSSGGEACGLRLNLVLLGRVRGRRRALVVFLGRRHFEGSAGSVDETSSGLKSDVWSSWPFVPLLFDSDEYVVSVFYHEPRMWTEAFFESGDVQARRRLQGSEATTGSETEGHKRAETFRPSLRPDNPRVCCCLSETHRASDGIQTKSHIFTSCPPNEKGMNVTLSHPPDDGEDDDDDDTGSGIHEAVVFEACWETVACGRKINGRGLAAQCDPVRNASHPSAPTSPRLWAEQT